MLLVDKKLIISNIASCRRKGGVIPELKLIFGGRLLCTNCKPLGKMPRAKGDEQVTLQPATCSPLLVEFKNYFMAKTVEMYRYY